MDLYIILLVLVKNGHVSAVRLFYNSWHFFFLKKLFQVANFTHNLDCKSWRTICIVCFKTLKNEKKKVKPFKNPNSSLFQPNHDAHHWTIAQIVKAIRGSDHFAALSRKEQTSRMLSARAMKEFFKTSSFYKKDVQENSTTKQTVLVGWRLCVEEY